MRVAAAASRRRGGAGFTLIELLVVVMIIAILSVVALPQYFRTVEKSRVAEASSLARAIADAQMRYQLQYGAYTGTMDDLDAKFPTNADLKFFNFSVAAGPPLVVTFTRDGGKLSCPATVTCGYTVTLSVDQNGVQSWGGTIAGYLKTW